MLDAGWRGEGRGFRPGRHPPTTTATPASPRRGRVSAPSGTWRRSRSWVSPPITAPTCTGWAAGCATCSPGVRRSMEVTTATTLRRQLDHPPSTPHPAAARDPPFARRPGPRAAGGPPQRPARQCRRGIRQRWRRSPRTFRRSTGVTHLDRAEPGTGVCGDRRASAPRPRPAAAPEPTAGESDVDVDKEARARGAAFFFAAGEFRAAARQWRPAGGKNPRAAARPGSSAGVRDAGCVRPALTCPWAKSVGHCASSTRLLRDRIRVDGPEHTAVLELRQEIAQSR